MRGGGCGGVGERGKESGYRTGRISAALSLTRRVEKTGIEREKLSGMIESGIVCN